MTRLPSTSARREVLPFELAQRDRPVGAIA